MTAATDGHLVRTVNLGLLAILVGLIAAPVIGFAVYVGSFASPKGTYEDLLAELVDADGNNPLEVSDLVGFRVARICVAAGGMFADMSRASGAQTLPAEPIRAGNVGVVVVGVEREDVAFGTVNSAAFGHRYDDLSATLPYCLSGDQLAIVFASINPPRNGQIIDLTYTDPATIFGAGQ